MRRDRAAPADFEFDGLGPRLATVVGKHLLHAAVPVAADDGDLLGVAQAAHGRLATGADGAEK
jgi:hypothetical protein